MAGFNSNNKIKLYNSDLKEFKDAKADGISSALQTINYEHHEVHSGSHYFIEGVQELTIDQVFDIQLTTPDTTKWSHVTFSLDCESETHWLIYEGASIVLAGSTVTPINNNRNSANTSDNTVAAIINADTTNANADTAVAEADLLAEGIVGSGKKSLGNEKRTNEVILKQNTIYCIRIIATAAGYVDYNMTWYEHTNL